MYELIITLSDKLIYNDIYDTLEDLQEYIYNVETLNKNKKKNKIRYKIKSHLPNEKIVVNFD
jgi:hypothetical protein